MKWIIITFLCLVGGFLLLAKLGERQTEYAIVHDCIYDTDGHCYTKQERP